MSFHIDCHEAPGDEFHRILVGQLKRAAAELAGATPDTRPRAIHSARKRLKKIRALLRLLHRAIPGGMPEACDTPLREASRELAMARDARVDVKTLAKLCRDFSLASSRVAGASRFIAEREKTVSASVSDAIHEAGILIASARFAIGGRKLSGLHHDRLRESVAAVYKRARKAFRKAGEEKSAENFHRCRKRSKDLLHILQLFKTCVPKSGRKLLRRARKLCDLLGREHDLAHLAATLSQCDAAVRKDMLEELIASSRLKLQQKILKLGTKFFAEKPEDFAAGIF